MDRLTWVAVRLYSYGAVLHAAAERIRTGNPRATKHRVTINLEDRKYRAGARPRSLTNSGSYWLGRQAIIEFLERYEKEESQLPPGLSPERRRAERWSR